MEVLVKFQLFGKLIERGRYAPDYAVWNRWEFLRAYFA